MTTTAENMTAEEHALEDLMRAVHKYAQADAAYCKASDAVREAIKKDDPSRHELVYARDRVWNDAHVLGLELLAAARAYHVVENAWIPSGVGPYESGNEPYLPAARLASKARRE